MSEIIVHTDLDKEETVAVATERVSPSDMINKYTYTTGNSTNFANADGEIEVLPFCVGCIIFRSCKKRRQVPPLMWCWNPPAQIGRK